MLCGQTNMHKDIVPGEVGEAEASDSHLINAKPAWLDPRGYQFPLGRCPGLWGLPTCPEVGPSVLKVWLLTGILCSSGIGPLL